ncbi:MAG: hypothetical protein ACREBB_06095 [Nitrosotalea sp.]
MQRGTIIMAAGLLIQVLNWIISATMNNSAGFQSIKGTLGTVTIFGWLLFFAGFGIRHLDKKKNASNPKKSTKL